ncbi:GNAT family N-acetyltransferase [Candidatus Dojkabacteria bacterium]|nr:GNAT family N-acetyltransferase [Candidatus Dojkabacteria bacterium]
MARIVKLDVTDWSIYRELRLQALKESPLAFTSTLHESLDKVADYWRGHLDSKNSVMLFAKERGKLVGTVAAVFNDKKRLSHIAEIAGNYVRKEHRGKGIGSMLMEGIIEEIKDRKKILKINLKVAKTQDAAIGLYEKFSFLKVGVQKKELSYDGKYYDLVLMEKLLDK